MAVHPGAVIAVAGLAVAGFKLYTALSNSAQIVRSSLERYNDEKIRYYTVNKQVLETVIDYGKFKLEIWDEFGALVQLFSRMTNPPGLISYKGMESVHAGRPQMDDIRNMTTAIKALHEQQWDVLGTGMLASLAIYGKTMTQKVEKDQVLHIDGFPDTEEGDSVLDSMGSVPAPHHSDNGLIEERSVVKTKTSGYVRGNLLQFGYHLFRNLGRNDGAIRIQNSFIPPCNLHFATGHHDIGIVVHGNTIYLNLIARTEIFNDSLIGLA